VTGLRFSFSSLGGSALVVHHTQQISMAAVAGDADNTYINKQARKMRTNRVNSPERANWKRICFSGSTTSDEEQAKGTASYAAPVGGARAA